MRGKVTEKEKQVLEHLYKAGLELLEYCRENGVEHHVLIDLRRGELDRDYDCVHVALSCNYEGGGVKEIADIFGGRSKDEPSFCKYVYEKTA